MPWKLEFPRQGTVISQAGNWSFFRRELEFPAEEITTTSAATFHYMPKKTIIAVKIKKADYQ